MLKLKPDVVQSKPAADKGTFGGECNRKVCANKPAEWFNHSTLKYYCSSCAGQINEYNYADAMRLFGHELCTKGQSTANQS